MSNVNKMFNTFTHAFHAHKFVAVNEKHFKRLFINYNFMRKHLSEMSSENTKLQLKFQRLSSHATGPSRGSPHAAGYDLYAAYDYTIPSMRKEMVRTDIAVAVPNGCYGRIAPRSGLAWKHFIDVGAGVIDQDYRGNVCVILFNFGEETFHVKRGDRIAQLICERIADTELVEENLDETFRGDNGFGSTGVNIESPKL